MNHQCVVCSLPLSEEEENELEPGYPMGCQEHREIAKKIYHLTEEDGKRLAEERIHSLQGNPEEIKRQRLYAQQSFLKWEEERENPTAPNLLHLSEQQSRFYKAYLSKFD